MSPSPIMPMTAPELFRRHLRFGWLLLLIFLTMGLLLEGFHGFKVAAYLNVTNETRRLMWTLCHAHGTLLGIVNVIFAFTLRSAATWNPRPRAFASGCLSAASLLMPGGFFLGGLFIHGGDPGIGIILLPVGGILLLIAVSLTLIAVSSRNFEQSYDPPAKSKK
jgi:hypothetical protein